jgi:hypothetical protein
MLRVSVSCYTYHKKAKLKPYFQQLCQQLIASFEVELSGDALLQQQRAKERWPEERYSDYLPPFHCSFYSKVYVPAYIPPSSLPFLGSKSNQQISFLSGM